MLAADLVLLWLCNATSGGHLSATTLQHLGGTAEVFCFFFRAVQRRRDLVRSRGLGDMYKRQLLRHNHNSIKQSTLNSAQKNSSHYLSC